MPKSRAEYQAIFAKLKAKGPFRGYDVKAKEKDVEILDPRLVFMKTGVGAVTGKSKKTGIAMYKILPSEV